MNITQLIAVLSERKIRLWLDGDTLRYQAPPGVMDAEIKAKLQGQKAELIAYLRIVQLPEQHPIELLTAQPPGSPVVVSFAQKRMLFMQQLNPDSSAFNIPLYLELTGPLDLPHLQLALQKVLEQHPQLRTRFFMQQEQYHAELTPSESFSIQRHPCSADTQEQVLSLPKRLIATPFDLQHQLPFAAHLLELGPQRHHLLLVNHHIVSDGWSQALILQSLCEFYQDPAANVQRTHLGYHDYAAWQSTILTSHPEYQRQLDYWLQQLAGVAPLLTIPTDFPRPAIQQFNGARETAEFPASLLSDIERYCLVHNLTSASFLFAALNLLLAKYSGQDDLVVGTTAANRPHVELEKICGPFINVLPIRTVLTPDSTVTQYMLQMQERLVLARRHQDVPFEQIVDSLKKHRELSYTPVFQVLFNHQFSHTAPVQMGDLRLQELSLTPEIAKYDLTFSTEQTSSQLRVALEFASGLFLPATAKQLLTHYQECIRWCLDHPAQNISQLCLSSSHQNSECAKSALMPCFSFNPTDSMSNRLAQHAHLAGQRTALIDGDQSYSYQDLYRRVHTVALALQQAGAKAGDHIGVRMERSIDMVAALFAVLHIGAAYVPVDPAYPYKRQQYMLENADIKLLLSQTELSDMPGTDQVPILNVDTIEPASYDCPHHLPHAAQLAYVIYTSGSTGQPKGVMISHANLQHFLTALDHTLGDAQEQVWLAVTSISFDISVVELLWTLSRGASVVLQHPLPTPTSEVPNLQFSLFYFAAANQEQGYNMMLDGARFADTHGLSAVWIPERHFHEFGGQYANPAVAAAAIAATTSHVHIRAGSVVAPLHHPARIAEEWAMVDRLSSGRVGLSMASGWHFNDFVFAPDLYQNRHQVLKERITQVKALWRGEQLPFTAGNGQQVVLRTMPRPVQAELPIWVTAATSIETFRYAGSAGLHLLTHLLGNTVAELAAKIQIYRQARAEHGHDPATGIVTLMLHTFIGDTMEQVRSQVETPFKNYLRSSVDLLRPVAESEGMTVDNTNDALIEIGFERYFASSALFGTVESCQRLIDELYRAGVNEIACLVDFGIEHKTVCQHLHYIPRLMQQLASRKQQHQLELRKASRYQPPEALLSRHAVSHLQCTPSYLSLLLQRPESRQVLSGLSTICLGGEAVTAGLVDAIRQLGQPELLNMYGPTETTVWSSISQHGTLLAPALTGEQIYILDKHGQPVPSGVSGHLFIGGAGVAWGYLRQPALTAERFTADPFSREPGARMYNTGDTGRWLQCGNIEFLGRGDHQVKIRGHRIEPGEIENVLCGLSGVQEAAVLVSKTEPPQLLAYICPIHPASFDLQACRQSLAELLPDYMMPGQLLIIDVMPRTPNGKLDRSQLQTFKAQVAPKQFVPAKLQQERDLSQLWQQLLKIDPPSVIDNFFDLGGNSFLLGELHFKMEQMSGKTFPLIELFKNPTIAAQAQLILQNTSTAPAIASPAVSQQNRDAVIDRRKKLKELRHG